MPTVLTDFIKTTAVDGILHPQDGSGYVKIKYRLADSPTAVQEVLTPTVLEYDLSNGHAETIVPNSVMFTFCGKDYIDINGQLYIDVDHETGVGTFAGTIDYSTGKINLNTWQGGCTNGVELKSLVTDITSDPVTFVSGRVSTIPVAPEKFSIRVTAMNGTLITGVADAQGEITGSLIQGFINYSTGGFSCTFGENVVAAGNENEDWYYPEGVNPDTGMIYKREMVSSNSMFYNAVSQTFLPLDSSVLGLDPVRLPQDGRVPCMGLGDVVVVLNDQTTVATYASGDVTDLGRVRLAKISVRDNANQTIDTALYSVDLETGIITWGTLTGVSQPITVIDRIEDMGVLGDVQITGDIKLSQPLRHDYIAGETIVSSAMIIGDMFANNSEPFDQKLWSGEWSDILIGDETIAEYDNANYPLVLENSSTIQERWLMLFDSSTTVDVIGEHTGQVLSGVPITGNIAPINPQTGFPYFTIPTGGWGAGWSSGNCLRFNTNGANAPSWLIQSVGQGDETDPDYNFCVETRGDIDTI